METILIVVNVILAIILVISVLLQRSEGGALGLVFHRIILLQLELSEHF